MEDGARVIDGFGHASGHPCPTMTHRVTLRYILDTMMHAITFLLISFFSPSPFLSYLYLYLFSFPSPSFFPSHSPVLLLKLPQLRVDVKGAPEVALPLFVPVLWQIP